jgi:hypothetical protein
VAGRLSVARRRAGSLLVLGFATVAAVSCVIAKADPPSAARASRAGSASPVPSQAESLSPVTPQAGSPSPVPSQAETSRPDPSEPGLPATSEVVVKGQREALEHRMQGFVRRITQNPRFSDESLPRWRAPVCFAVAGLPTTEGLFVLDRLAHIAGSAGARVARRLV